MEATDTSDDREARRTMTEEQMTTEPANESAPQRPGFGRLAAIGAAIVLVVLVASAAGAVVGHELWTSTRSAAPAPVATPSPGNSGGSGFFGGSGGSGFFGGSGGSSTGNGGGSAGSGGPSNAAAIAAKVNKAIVDIDASNTYQGSMGAGTGIVISSDGKVLTNNHVIRGATRISVTDVGNGKTYDADVVGYDASHDVAVLQLQGASGLATAALGDSSKLSVGDGIVGIGNAGGTGSPSYAGGAVTGLGKSITATDELGGSSEQLSNLIQVDANIQPGDSGGPLVDSNGTVVGMITAGSAGFSGFDFGGTASGAAYAIPIDDASKLALQMIAGHGSSTTHIGGTAFLGVSVASSGDGFGAFFGGGQSGSSSSGVTVGNVIANEPAQKAGLAAGDTITAIDGRSIDSPTALSRLMLGHHPGDQVKLAWTDTSGASHSASVVLGSGPPA
jgi:S1-C subfamily serine protease